MRAMRVDDTDLTQKQLDELGLSSNTGSWQTVTTELRAYLNTLKLPSQVSESTVVRLNGNQVAWEVAFDADRRYGLVLTQYKGQWLVHCDEYSWKEMTRLDLCIFVNTGENGADQLVLEPLK